MGDETPLLVSAARQRREFSDEGTVRPLGRRVCCCCDSKRGTIVVNIIVLIFAVISLIVRAVMYNNSDFEKKVTNPENIEIINANYVPFMVLDGLTIGVAIAVVLGANMYNFPLVAVGAIWHVAVLWYGTTVTAKLNYEGSDYKWFYKIWPIFPFILTLIVVSPMVSTVMLILVPAKLITNPCIIQILFIIEVRCGIMSPQTYQRERYSCCCNV